MTYEIIGGNLPAILCRLEQGEQIVCESGAMSWMDDVFTMTTNGGGIGKMFGKMLSGESMFENIYTAQGSDGMIAFTTSVPGNIMPFELDGTNSIIGQKCAYLACDSGVNMEITFQKKFGAGLVGGEGFIMEKFTGTGTVLLEVDGSVIEKELAPGEELIAETGALCAMESTVTMDVVTVKGLGNMLVGGEGFFNTKLTGPGKIWLQTMPIMSLAGSIAPYIPSR